MDSFLRWANLERLWPPSLLSLVLYLAQGPSVHSLGLDPEAITCLYHLFLPPRSLILTGLQTVPSPLFLSSKKYVWLIPRPSYGSSTSYLMCFFKFFFQGTCFLGVEDPFISQVWFSSFLYFFDFSSLVRSLGLHRPYYLYKLGFLLLRPTSLPCLHGLDFLVTFWTSTLSIYIYIYLSHFGPQHCQKYI